MPTTRRRPCRALLGTRPARAFEPLERRRLMCAAHASGFAWTDPHDPDSLARERTRIASLYDLAAPASAAALRAPAASAGAPGLPILNSNPGAAVDIYLDFDGDIGTGPGSSHQMVTPYDTNGDPGTFDAVEAAVVTQAWSMVSAYFAMFDVNVTTDTPTRPFAWCAIGNNVAGGYSYVDVFPQTLGASPESYTSAEFARSRASGIAHEVGHNFGLQHQADFDALGKLAAEYTSGYDVQHGALMGADYAQRVHKWAIGHPSNNVRDLQDDMAIIADRIALISGGDGYRTDDVGGTTALAASMVSNGANQTRAGILERLGDVDVFAFNSTGGRYLVEASRDVESGVDLKLEVLDSAGRLIAAEDAAANNDAQVAIDLPAAGTYYARLASHGNYGDVGRYVLNVSPLPTSGAFDSVDVGGTLRRAGGASYDAAADAFTLRGAGNDIGGVADQFRYLFQRLHGDGSIVARLATLSGGAAFAKAGLMIRESLDANAAMATAHLRIDGVAEAVHRSAANAFSASTAGGSAAAGVWLRLSRAGNIITASRSDDGIAWTTIDVISFASLPADVLIGLAVTSNRETSVATASFDHVSTSGQTGPATFDVNELAAPTDLTVAPTPTGDGLRATWDAVAGAGAYAVERSTDGVNYVLVGIVADAQYADASLPGSYRYFYRVRSLADATSTSPRSAAAAIESGVNRPSGPVSVTTISLNRTTIILDWRDVTGESGYRIERSRDNFATFIVAGEVDANVTGFVDGVAVTLQASTTYQYRIVPLSALGDGVPSPVAIEGTRFATVTGLRTTSSTPDSLTVSWDDLKKSETGYRIERSANDGLSYTLVGVVDGDVTSYVDGGLESFTSYLYRLTALSPYTESLTAGLVAGVTQAEPSLPAQALPAGWASTDIGAVRVAGASGAGGTGAGSVRMYGGGSDIGGSADQFQFAYRRLSGDGEFVARLVTLDATNAQPEAGLMFRSSLADDSRFAAVNFSADGWTAQFEYRSATGATAKTLGTTPSGPTMWMKLVRAGDTVSGYRSADGSSWSLLGSATIDLGSTIYVGLATSAHALARLGQVAFDNVGGSAVAQADTDAPATPTFVVSDDTGLSPADGVTRDDTLLLSGAAEPGTRLTLTLDGEWLASVTVPYTGLWQYSLPARPDGTYTVAAVATDAAGNSSPAATRVVTIDRAAPAIGSIVFDRETSHRWLVRFDEAVSPATLSGGGFSIVDRATGARVTPIVIDYDASTHTATLALPGDVRLANGRYGFECLPSGTIEDLAGNLLTAASTLPFDVLAGDLDGSGRVDFADLLQLAKHYGQSGQGYSAGNIDYDPLGVVGFGDLLLLAKAYNTGLPALAPVAATATPIRKRASAFSEIAI